MFKKMKWKFASFERRAVILRRLGAKVGEKSEIYADVDFGSEPYLTSIGNHVRITGGVRFVTHDGGIWVLRGKQLPENADVFGRITVGDNVHIGMNAIIMPNVNIGSNCVIGCGAVVTRDIPSNSIAAGVPAKTIESIDSYYEKKKDTCCSTKHMDYKQKKSYLLKNYL